VGTFSFIMTLFGTVLYCAVQVDPFVDSAKGWKWPKGRGSVAPLAWPPVMSAVEQGRGTGQGRCLPGEAKSRMEQGSPMDIEYAPGFG
jgi:hypothetical protein